MKERGNAVLKRLDRAAGIPLVRLLGLLRRRRAVPAEIRSVGLLKEVAVGDTVILSGVVQDIRRCLPSARLVMFAGATNTAVARLLPWLDEVIPLPITSPLACVRELRRHPVDVLMDCAGWSRISALYSALANASYRVGFRTAGQFRHYAYDDVADNLGTRHELENFRALAALIGVDGGALPYVPVPPDTTSPIEPPYAVFHPWPSGTMSHVKEWPERRWVALARLVLAAGMRVVLSGSRQDAPRSAHLARAIGASDDVIDAAGALPFPELPALLADAEVVVSVNTGIMHLAAAVGARTVGLNGPTAEHRWGPIGPRAVAVSVPPPEGGYLNLGFEYDGHPHDVMRRIEVERVWSAIEELRA